MNIAKNVGAVVLGLVVGMIAITLMHVLGELLYPLPEGVDGNNPESLAAYIPTMPFGAFMMVLLAHQSGAFFGSIAAVLVLRKSGNAMRLGFIVGALMMVFGIMNLFMLPHPAWFAIVDTVLYIPLALLGARMVMRKT